MTEIYQKDGIIFFKSPYRTKITEWVGTYLDCDAVVDNIDYDNDTMLVYAYSKNFEEIKKIKGKHQILGSLSSQEVNCID